MSELNIPTRQQTAQADTWDLSKLFVDARHGMKPLPNMKKWPGGFRLFREPWAHLPIYIFFDVLDLSFQ